MTDKSKTNLLLTIDIETLPTEDSYFFDIPTMDEVGENKSLKDPVKIAAWKEDKLKDLTDKAEQKAAEDLHKTGLVSHKGRIFCIGYAKNDEPAKCVDFLQGEKEMLEAFYDDIKGYNTYRIAMHNVEFDSLFLAHRAAKHGVWGLVEILRTDHGYNRDKYYDTMNMAGFGLSWKYRISLRDLCDLLGVDNPKDEMDGSEVFQYYLNGRYEEIKKYCLKDVNATRQCYYKLK